MQSMQGHCVVHLYTHTGPFPFYHPYMSSRMLTENTYTFTVGQQQRPPEEKKIPLKRNKTW